MSDFAFTPTKEQTENSNVFRFMRKHNIRTLQELHKRSITDINWYWDAVNDDNGVVWDKKYSIIIDDDQEIVERFVQFLKRFNVETLSVAFNGLTANELYEKYRPDVVFLDLVMPEQDGFVTCKKLKDEFPDAKVIVITAHLDVDITEKLVRLQPFGILPKPFEAHKAMLLIQRLNLATTLEPIGKITEIIK